MPIYYESRLARIELDEDEKPKLDAEVEALTEDEAVTEQEKLKAKWATVEQLVGSEKRVALVAKDLVAHFEDRLAALDGKAMVVCMSRRICVALYDEIVKLRPDWHSTDDNSGAIKIVMTGAASDPPAWQQHIGNKTRRDLLAKRARDAKDPLKLVIVRDMWLTGFDARACTRCTWTSRCRVTGSCNHRPRQSRVPRQTCRSDRGLHRHCSKFEVGTGTVFGARPGNHGC